jgi:hydroxylamine reductase
MSGNSRKQGLHPYRCVCGKSADTANLQDLLRYVTIGLSVVTTRLRSEGKTVDKEVNHQVTKNLFTTITTPILMMKRFMSGLEKTLKMKENLLAKLSDQQNLPDAATWQSHDRSEMAEKAKTTGVLRTADEDVRSLRELIIYGLKGLSAYVEHANVLKHEDESIDAFIQNALAKTLDDSLSVNDLVALTLETGSYGVKEWLCWMRLTPRPTGIRRLQK